VQVGAVCFAVAAPTNTAKEENLSIIRSPRPESSYLTIANEVIRDERISYRARGLLVAILSRPDNWVIRAEDLSRQGKEGRDAIRGALAELQLAGYVRIEKTRVGGQFATNSYVYDSPQPISSDGESATVFQALLEVPVRTTVKNKDLGDSIIAEFDQFWNIYGKKVGSKPGALRAFREARKKTSLETILKAIPLLHGSVTGIQFIPHAATWLNGERWLDEYDTRSKIGQTASPPPMSEADRREHTEPPPGLLEAFRTAHKASQ
jgi:hypothetical protein